MPTDQWVSVVTLAVIHAAGYIAGKGLSQQAYGHEFNPYESPQNSEHILMYHFCLW